LLTFKDVKLWIEDLRIRRNYVGTTCKKTIYAMQKNYLEDQRDYLSDIRCMKSHGRITSALRQEFSQKISYNVQKELQNRKKKRDDTYSKYCYKMLEIASSVKMETSAIILQYIIDKDIIDKVIRNYFI